MSSGWDLAIIGGTLLAYAVVSGRLNRSPITSAIVFTGLGLLVGTEVLDLLDTQLGSEDLRLLAEVTLALVLFSDASSLDARALRRQTTLPVRLLGIALPLTIAAGTLVAIPLFGELGLFEAVMLAVVLAPTDAALGSSVVSDRRLPGMVRQGLNVESGLNDGVCVPLLVAAVTFAELEETPSFEGELVVDLIEEVVVAVVVGAAVAVAVAYVIRLADRHRWIEVEWDKLIPVATVAVAYGAAAALHGSGFIAAFTAGLVYGLLLGERARSTVTLDEEVGLLLSAVTFLFFGAVMVGRAVDGIDVETVVYAILSLTLVRMVPVAISLFGTGARPPTVAFVGWFGPRGLASIVFTLTIVEESGLPGTARVIDVATVTVLLSVLLHGVTAPVLTNRYASWLAGHRDGLAGASSGLGAPMLEADT